MNVRCPHCQSTFRVDPDRVPAAGIKARCSRCSNIFELAKDGSVRMPVAAAPAAAAPPPRPPVTPQPPAPPIVPPIPAAPVVQPPMAPPAMAPRPVTPAAPAPAAPAAAPPRPIPQQPMAPPPAAAPAVPAAAGTPAGAAAPARRASFRNQDPGARAQRLARALVSDIVAYNKDKMKQTSGAAALRAEFREEIRKSWEEYVEQVGLETAKSTPYFRDALNDILAKGEKVF